MKRAVIWVISLSPVAVALAFTGCANTRPDLNDSHPTRPIVSATEQYILKDYEWEVSTDTPPQPNSPVTLNLDVQENTDHEPIQDAAQWGKHAHLLVVRRDLTSFAHVHPEVTPTGQVQVQTQFPSEGTYFLFFQFSPQPGNVQILHDTLQVGSVKTPKAHLSPDSNQTKTIEGYGFTMTPGPIRANMPVVLPVSIEKAGKPVTEVEPYTGEAGYAFIISENGRDYWPAHPAVKPVNGLFQSPVAFHTRFPRPGLYKIWMQFRLAETMKTVDFTVQVR